MHTKMCYLLPRISASRVIFIVILIFAASLLYTYNERLRVIRAQRKDISHLKSKAEQKSLKYILLWTSRFLLPLNTMGQGNSVFVKGKCNYTNCFVTDNKNYLIDQTDFDAVLFGGLDVIHLGPHQLPSKRSPKQKFVFAASESPANFPVCDDTLNGFFNWTWTYKLDSNLHWGYFIIYDLDGNVVGPAIDMKWRKSLDPINDEIEAKLSKKSKAAAWFVTHCDTKGGREYFVEELQQELKAFGWAVDVYGKCGTLTCTRANEKSCFKMLEKDYYFYLSFENSLCEDYVTEKVYNALNNYAVPVVYGTSNYSRYLPPGSYLDAIDLGPKQLARRMSEIIADRDTYHDFFRWRNHYRYVETYPPDEVCKFCKLLNDEEKVSQVTVWDEFRVWWNGGPFKGNC